MSPLYEALCDLAKARDERNAAARPVKVCPMNNIPCATISKETRCSGCANVYLCGDLAAVEQVAGAPLDWYSLEDQAFFRFWYGQPPLADVSHSTARYIWDAARENSRRTDLRTLFEAWAADNHLDIHKATDDGYFDAQTAAAWFAWQGCAEGLDDGARDGGQQP